MDFKVNIADLLADDTGSAFTVNVDSLDQLELMGLRVANDTSLDLDLMRIPDGIVAMLPAVTLPTHAICDRCLAEYDYELAVPAAELIYYQVLPDEEEDQDYDYELIDRKRNEINVKQFLTEAVQISLPEKMLCKPDCPGIVYKKESKAASAGQNPFAQLKGGN
jgi:uncharacterized metal-binding protein YceD (DUF177 family)